VRAVAVCSFISLRRWFPTVTLEAGDDLAGEVGIQPALLEEQCNDAVAPDLGECRGGPEGDEEEAGRGDQSRLPGRCNASGDATTRAQYTMGYGSRCTTHFIPCVRRELEVYCARRADLAQSIVAVDPRGGHIKIPRWMTCRDDPPAFT